MKRIFSNKSGFTLIEIVVAFAVFAIMASMIMQMVRLTVAQRNANNVLANDISDDGYTLATHYLAESEKFGASETKDGDFVFDFQAAGAGQISIPYAVRNAMQSADMDLPNYVNIDPSDPNYLDTIRNPDGINYFVGQGVDYNNTSDDSDPDNITNPLGNNVTARVDTRLSGSKNLGFIWINKVVQDPTNSCRYFIECAADGTSVAAEDMAYIQYRLRFCSSSETSTVETKENGKTYIYTIPKDAVIKDYGYINDDELVWDADCIPAKSHSFSSPTQTWNRYTVTKTSSNTIRVGLNFYPKWQTGGTPGYEMSGSVLTRFWVEFESDPGLTVDSFGQSVTGYTNKTSYGSGYKYTNYPMNDGTGDDHINIYGAFEYNKAEKVGS